ncbi:transcription initiation factor IIB [Coemansia spiralis]|uniref:Transcription initiation factor IIB n=2 Tax=Coemansia TaxID=4863 RepID=A0A9W8KZR8_9FUNG|nr:cyclin-like protein [Coemansia spiralis]KAJ1992696.1 transcription initiation factor IIB [Coemansia umbellata]KAJ2623285.1 transcription initiation factor IIB [Coemansia sp. RSA 1358]KAJ2678837.1 transcription initiation factor IIB [Coemansia spiralis]
MSISKLDEKFCVKLECPYCTTSALNLIEDFTSGDLLCGDCGLVLGDRIVDTKSEWRTFQDSDGPDQSRVGEAANPYLDGVQLDTVIGSGGDNGSGLARTLNRVQGLTGSSKNNHNLVEAYKEISGLCDAYDMSRSTVDIAKQLYKKVESEPSIYRGKKANVLIAACIFVACRQDGAPRTYKEICSLTKVHRKEVRKALTFLQSKLGTVTGTTSSDDLIARFCSNLHLGNDVRIITKLLSQKTKDLDKISGKNPISIAAACIHMVTQLLGIECDVKYISEIAGISESTIRQTYRILYERREELITPEILARNPQASIDLLVIK